MLGSVLQYVLGIVFGFFGAVLLLRAWLYYWALSPRHPLCELTRKITDWLVAPLSKALKPKGGIDWASVVAAFFTAIIAVLLLGSDHLGGAFLGQPRTSDDLYP